MLTQEQQQIVRSIIASLMHDVDSPDADIETLLDRTRQAMELIASEQTQEA